MRLDETHIATGGISGAIAALVSYFTLREKVGKDTCRVCKDGTDTILEALRADIKQGFKDLKGDIKLDITRVHERLDKIRRRDED
jgi:hypothetical protein